VCNAGLRGILALTIFRPGLVFYRTLNGCSGLRIDRRGYRLGIVRTFLCLIRVLCGIITKGAFFITTLSGVITRVAFFTPKVVRRSFRAQVISLRLVLIRRTFRRDFRMGSSAVIILIRCNFSLINCKL